MLHLRKKYDLSQWYVPFLELVFYVPTCQSDITFEGGIDVLIKTIATYGSRNVNLLPILHPSQLW